MIDKTNEQASKVLGKTTNYPTKYDPKQLVRIERILNRSQYGIDEKDLKFTGIDVWHCYEMSTLTNDGVPVHFVGKMIVPADSKYIVESKSMKLYTFSFNMSKFGKDRESCIEEVCKTVEKDLSKLLECEVKFGKANSTFEMKPFYQNYTNVNFAHKFDTYKETPDFLVESDKVGNHRLQFGNFRSNCRVTNQPDFATIIIEINNAKIDLEGLHKYLVSFRNESHFHEEIIEAIFTRLNDKYKHDGLLVMGLYTRRGGIDIVPVRASSEKMLNQLKDLGLYDEHIRLWKTPQQ